jgi:hypothetical protein
MSEHEERGSFPPNRDYVIISNYTLTLLEVDFEPDSDNTGSLRLVDVVRQPDDDDTVRRQEQAHFLDTLTGTHLRWGGSHTSEHGHGVIGIATGNLRGLVKWRTRDVEAPTPPPPSPPPKTHSCLVAEFALNASPQDVQQAVDAQLAKVGVAQIVSTSTVLRTSGFLFIIVTTPALPPAAAHACLVTEFVPDATAHDVHNAVEAQLTQVGPATVVSTSTVARPGAGTLFVIITRK